MKRLFYIEPRYISKDAKIILFSTLTGTVVQIICKIYLKNHPELLEKNIEDNEPATVSKRRSLSRWIRHVLKFKGGALVEIIGIKGVRIGSEFGFW